MTEESAGDTPLTDPLAEKDAHGEIQVKRPRRGTMDIFRAYHVLLDGRDAGEISRGGECVVAIEPGAHKLHIEIDWCRSPSLSVDVAAGQRERFVCYPRYPAWRASKALANPDEWIVLSRTRSES